MYTSLGSSCPQSQLTTHALSISFSSDEKLCGRFHNLGWLLISCRDGEPESIKPNKAILLHSQEGPKYTCRVWSIGYTGGTERTFACKSQECLWQDWYILKGHYKLQVNSDWRKQPLYTWKCMLSDGTLFIVNLLPNRIPMIGNESPKTNVFFLVITCRQTVAKYYIIS